MNNPLMVLLRRLITAITMPFRVLLVRGQRLFNLNVLSARLIQPLTRQVRELFKLRPSKREDYFVIGRFMVYKKLVALIILVLCASVFIYFEMFSDPIHVLPPPSVDEIHIEYYFVFNDPNLRDFTGLAFIMSFYGDIVYAGEIVRGEVRGEGFLYNPEWEGMLLYRGQFENNQYNGQGILYFRNGLIRYRGEFRDNLFHGEGELFAESGGLVYSGQFVAGEFEGNGRLFSNGILIYDGTFASGLPHGSGTWFRPNGLIMYRGEFRSGMPHGIGTLYDEDGRELYTGSMFEGRINFRSLLGASLADTDNLFRDIPVLFYSDGSYASFFFERAGVLVTTTSRVQVYEWEREWESFFEGFTSLEAPDYRPPNNNQGLPSFVERTRSLYFEIDRGVWQSEAQLDRSRIFIRRVTVLGGIQADADSIILPLGYVFPYSDGASISMLPTVPDNSLNIYAARPAPNNEDAVMINHIQNRGHSDIARAFDNISFEIDQQNRMFQRIWRLEHRVPIYQRIYEVNDRFLYRFFFHRYPEEGEDLQPVYFSLEAL